jgi:1,4-dihydroxy-2-naphthoate octaprenyltransferase
MKQIPASSSPLLLFIRLTRPFFLLGGILMYALGVGIVHYLGTQINWPVYWLGQIAVTLLQMSAQYLNEYFDFEMDSQNPNRTFFSGGSGLGNEQGLPRRIALWAAFATLGGFAICVVFLYQSHLLKVEVFVLLLLAVLGALLYSIPPIRLVSTGYGELSTSILVANIVPAFAFALQYGSLHRLLPMVTFPLTALHLAMLIAFSLPDFANDVKFGKRTLLVRLGWERAMLIHNVLILLAYVFLVLAIVEGLPLRLAWPGFLTLPLAVFQIWRMNQIAQGAPTRYNLLTFAAIALFGLTAYFLAFSFWTG